MVCNSDHCFLNAVWTSHFVLVLQMCHRVASGPIIYLPYFEWTGILFYNQCTIARSPISLSEEFHQSQSSHLKKLRFLVSVNGGNVLPLMSMIFS